MDLLTTIARALYDAVMLICSIWCHQIFQRSPQIFGLQGPLCWRCSGIAAGILILLVYIFALRRRLASLTASLSLALLLPLDVLANSLGFTAEENARRLITGIIWGIFGTSALLSLSAYAASKMTDSFNTRMQKREKFAK
ncbi:MAG: DUF2085 domain-containing protein [Pyrinomonadaceae bacterium]